ncbi:MAG: GerMN domain-containing protein [Clostridiales bacterium]|nr:GerMN domain-containing protein [Clostridiales bacterium]
MKYFRLLTIVLFVLMCGCSHLEQGKNYPEPTAAIYNCRKEYVEYIQLYMPAEDRKTVVPSTQPVYVPQGREIYLAIMDALTNADEIYRERFSYILRGVKCNGIRKVDNILYIDFAAEFNEMPIDEMCLALMTLSGTYTRFEDIAYINVTCDGTPVFLSNCNVRPVLALENKYLTVDAFKSEFARIQRQFDKLDAKSQEQVAMILYSKTNIGSLTPEVRSIHVTDFHYCDTALNELLRGAEKEGLLSIYQGSISLYSPCIYDAYAGTLRISFLVTETQYLDQWDGYEQIAATMIHILPNFKRLQIAFLMINEEASPVLCREIDYELPESFYTLCQSVRVELPDESLASLSASSFYCDEWKDEKIYADILQRIWVDESAAMTEIRRQNGIMQHVFQHGVLHVWTEGRTIVVDLSSELMQAFQGLSAEQEKMLVYSMVNSLLNHSTYMKNVQILCNGRTQPYFSNVIRIEEPVYRLSGVTVF